MEPDTEKRARSLTPRGILQARRLRKAKASDAQLWIDNISVSFDGFQVLDKLNILIESGELRCIIGPNGAGKTTMMDIITGKTKPDSGSVLLSRKFIDVTKCREDKIVELGIGRKFQRPTVFDKLSVFDNVLLSCTAKKGPFRTLFSQLSGEIKSKIESILETIGLKDDADSPGGVLAHGKKQWLELGMLLAQDPKVLLIDEPVAGMTPHEVDKTAELLTSLAGKRTVIVVEHDMEFIRKIARTVTVLHEGRVIAEGTMEKVQTNPKVIEVYLGASVD